MAKSKLLTSNQYVNAGINNIAVGGIGANQGPFNTTQKNMWDRLLYSFSQQTSILTISPSAVFEKGVTQTPLLMTATTTRSTNPTYAITSTVFKRAGGVIDTQAGDTTPLTFSIIMPLIIDTTVFSIEVTNSNAYTSTDSKTITAVYPFYRGVGTAGIIFNGIDHAAVEVLLTKNVSVKSNKDVTTSPTTQRYFFMYPASYGALTSILDNSLFETISDYDVFTYNVIALNGTTQSYYVYQSKNDTTQINFTNHFKF